MLVIGIIFYSTGQNTSNADGDWSDNGTWVGTSPGFTNLANTTINSYVIANSGISFENSNNRTLTVNDTLIVHGDVIFNATKNNATITIGTNNVLIILGDLELGKNTAGVTIAAGGVLVVDGTISAAGVEGNSSISGAGDVYSPNSSGVNTSGTNSGGINPITDLTGDGFETIEEFVNGGGSTPLPVELLFFNAKNSNSAVQLNWATATEINNDHFIIERSEDGAYFYEIGRVDGNGNSTEQIEYSFTDQFVLNEVQYYRLTQVDYDGQSEQFEIKRIDTSVDSPASLLTVYPTIVTDDITIKSAEPFHIKNVSVTSLDGKLSLDLQNSIYQENAVTYTSRLDHLPSGNYLIRIVTSEGYLHSTKLKVN